MKYLLFLIFILQLVLAGFIILGFRFNQNLGYILSAIAVLIAVIVLRRIIPLMILQFAIIYFAMKVGRNLSKSLGK